MAPTYTLKINSIECVTGEDGRTGVVARIHWRYVGSLEDKEAAFWGSTDLIFDPDQPFIPYSDLSESQVASWVTTSWSDDQKALYEKLINEQLHYVPNPLPWGKA